jgi:peroxiredoxin
LGLRSPRSVGPPQRNKSGRLCKPIIVSAPRYSPAVVISLARGISEPPMRSGRIARETMKALMLIQAMAIFCAAAMQDAASSKPAPDFRLKDLSGKQVKLSDYRGKVVVINFWATWCAPCRSEVPDLVRLRELYHDRGLEVIGISLDDEEDREEVVKFVKSFKVNYPVVMGDLEVFRAYGQIDSIPVTFVIDKRGAIRYHHIGMITFDEVEGQVKSLL